MFYFFLFFVFLEMGREWWKTSYFAPFSVEIGSEFFFLNDPLAVLLLPSLQTPPSRPFSNLTSALLHVCLVQGPPSSIALVSGSTAYNASNGPSFQTRSVAPPRLELSLRKGKLRPKRMDKIGMMSHRKSARMKKNHVGGGMPGAVT